MQDPETQDTKQTPLSGLHRELGARMVPFAGYAMPLQFEGILAEHGHTRSHAGLFDVSHMGQAVLVGNAAAARLETLVPGDIQALGPGRMRYTMLTNAAGGILDDLMVTRIDDRLFVVVNAACKEQDFALLETLAGPGCSLEILTGRALLALQGPGAAAVLIKLCPESGAMPFMSAIEADVGGIACLVTRSGYTGEDGFEISVPADEADALARRLLADAGVKPVGLGARDSLRLEAGLCLYGNDIDASTTPIEAGLAWTISKRRRADGGFPGDAIIRKQLQQGVRKKRVGLKPDGKAPARAHTKVTDGGGTAVGEVTSGGFGPSVGGPVAMGYVEAGQADPGTVVNFIVRGKSLPGRVAALPFTPHKYFKS